MFSFVHIWGKSSLVHAQCVSIKKWEKLLSSSCEVTYFEIRGPLIQGSDNNEFGITMSCSNWLKLGIKITTEVGEHLTFVLAAEEIFLELTDNLLDYLHDVICSSAYWGGIWRQLLAFKVLKEIMRNDIINYIVKPKMAEIKMYE